MSDAWLAFLVIFAMLMAIWRIADSRERPMTKSEQERMFFRQTYSLSIDRMLSESPLDRELRSPPRTYFSPTRLLPDTSRLGDNAVLDQQVRSR